MYSKNFTVEKTSMVKRKALEVEGRAKEASDKKERARLHLEAAKLYRQVGDEKNFKWNLANHYSTKAEHLSRSGEFDGARKFYDKAEERFLELNLSKPAFYCASDKLRTYVYEGEDTLSSLFLESKWWLLDKYKQLSDEPRYIWDEHMYWNAQAQIAEKGKRFSEAAGYFRKSAETVFKVDNDRGQDEYVNQYKCLAIANKYDKDTFEKYIDRAIQLASERQDEKQKFYLLGLKHDHLAKLVSNMEKVIEHFQEAKQNHYRAGVEVSGKTAEFMSLYMLSKKELRNKNYQKAKSFLNKAISAGRGAQFPNIIPSLDVLSHEKFRYEGYLYISQGEFAKASDRWQQWLGNNEEIHGTKIYQSVKILKDTCSLLSKENLSAEDLFKAEDLIKSVREFKLDSAMHSVCSLGYSLTSLRLHGIDDERLLKEIKLKVIDSLSTEETAEELRNRLDIRRAIDQRSWLLSLPPKFVEKFDSCLYFLNNVLEEYKHTAVREFYVLLENFLKVIIEFNAKVLWGEAWKSKVENRVSEAKNFERFTFGDFIQVLRFLNDNKGRFCKNISDEIFKMLDKHAEIRNRLTHDFISELQEFDIVEDTTKIMYGLLPSFPTCIKVSNTKKMPWYDIEILWNQLPKRVSLYSEEKLEKGDYYLEPIPYLELIPRIENDKLYPNLIISTERVNDV